MLRLNSALCAAIAVLALAFATGASAQEYPAKRVRPQHLAENWQGSPEAYLTAGRVVVRSFEIDMSSGNMRITGKLWSDFEVESGNGVPAGQLMGLEIDVGLYEISSDIDDKLGTLVPTQEVKCKVTSTEQAGDVTLGIASFTMPDLVKPLPPGTYRLVAKLPFAKQSKAAKEAIMWVADLYGVMPIYDENGMPTADSTRVYKSKDHKDAWKDMTENEVCKSAGTLFLGNTVKGGAINIKTAGGDQNVLCRDASYDVYVDLEALDTQRKQLDDQYAIDKKNPDLDEKVKKVMKDAYEKSVKLLDMLMARAGGKLDAKEGTTLSKTKAAMTTLKNAIIAFEDDLNLKYWIALDTFHYYFHSINKVGYNCSVAIDKGNTTLDREAREKIQKDMEDPIAKKARDDKREQAFLYIPEPIKKAAYDYYRRTEETTEFDSASYTSKAGKEVVLDPAKWSKYRVKFIATFRDKSAAALASVDVSLTYAIQKWGEAYKQLIEVRDSILIHIYCYEYYLRMIPVEKEIGKGGNKQLRADADKQITTDWETEAGEQIKELKPLFPQAKGSPSAVYGRFESASKQARKALDMPDYAYRYMLNVQKKIVPPPRRYKQG
jgi:hypothetical protein